MWLDWVFWAPHNPCVVSEVSCFLVVPVWVAGGAVCVVVVRSRAFVRCCGLFWCFLCVVVVFPFPRGWVCVVFREELVSVDALVG